MATTAEMDVSQLSFEAALQRLEEIVRRLKRHCEARLKDAQARIEQIAFGSDGKPAGLKPFDAA